MSNYTRSTNFTAKDALPTGNPSKTILGFEHDAEYNAIATAIATKLDSTGSAANLTALPAAEGGALTLIDSQTASSDATLDFVIDSSTYSNFSLVLVNVKPATAGAELWLRGMSNSSTAITSGYQWARFNLTTAGTTSGTGSTSDAKIMISNAVGGDDGEQFSGIVNLRATSGLGMRAEFTGESENNAGTYFSATGFGVYAAAVPTHVRIMFSSGNISAGTIHLYGRKSS